MRPWWAWLFWVWLAFATLLIAMATLGLDDFRILELPIIDKLIHFVVFGVLGFLGVGWFVRAPAGRVLGLLAAISLLDELSQLWLPNRSFELLDIAATWAGLAVLGPLGARARRRWQEEVR